MVTPKSKRESQIFLIFVGVGVFYAVFYSVFILYSIHGQ